MKEYFLSRYMIGLLFFTVSSQVIGTFWVFGKPIILREYLIFLFLWLIFLFYMRVVDDYNDRDHDATFYRERSLQRWIIDLKKLFLSAFIALWIIAIIFLWFFGIIPVVLIFLAVGNTSLSILWFGLGKNLRFQNILLYHFLNSFGLSLIQVCLYFVLWEDAISWILVGLHFALMFTNNFLIEVVRKLKSKHEVSHNDDYISLIGKTWNYVGINILVLMLITGNILLFFLFGNLFHYWLTLYIFFGLLILFLCFLYYKNNSKKRKNTLIIGSLLFYLFSNFVYFFL